MDNLISRNIQSFTDMNDRSRSSYTYEVGDIEAHRHLTAQITSITLKLYDAGAVFSVYYDDGTCRVVVTNRFSAISNLEKYDNTSDPGR